MKTATHTQVILGVHCKIHILHLLGMEESKKRRYAEFSEASTKISTLISQCKELFEAKDGTEEWHAYLEYVDEIIVTGLLRAAASSIGYFLDETDTSLTQGILFQIRLELEEPEIAFRPALDKNIVGNFFDQLTGYCTDIFHMAELIPRVAAHLTPQGHDNTYLDLILNHKELKMMKETLMTRVQDVMMKANKLKTVQMEYATSGLIAGQNTCIISLLMVDN